MLYVKINVRRFKRGEEKFSPGAPAAFAAGTAARARLKARPGQASLAKRRRGPWAEFFLSPLFKQRPSTNAINFTFSL
ncbi:MAG: hypothetical protein DBY09_02545 [Selenomonadales bacterium]|nr:MAG: hypothetical protein DBY09_02545 [Selenomonadales bacterium]